MDIQISWYLPRRDKNTFIPPLNHSGYFIPPHQPPFTLILLEKLNNTMIDLDPLAVHHLPLITSIIISLLGRKKQLTLSGAPGAVGARAGNLK